MRTVGMTSKTILLGAFLLLMGHSVSADRSHTGFGHFRPLDGAEEKTHSSRQRERYTAGREYGLRPYTAVPLAPPVQYRFRGSPEEDRKRYAMPGNSVNRQRPPSSPGNSRSGSAEWSMGPSSAPVPRGYSLNPAPIPGPLYPGYRFRPLEKTDNKTKR